MKWKRFSHLKMRAGNDENSNSKQISNRISNWMNEQKMRANKCNVEKERERLREIESNREKENGNEKFIRIWILWNGVFSARKLPE